MADQFGTHHAVMIADSFFENVSRQVMKHRELTAGEHEQNVVLQFTPKPRQSMFTACLYSHWNDPKEPDLRRLAAITDEQPATTDASSLSRRNMWRRG